MKMIYGGTPVKNLNIVKHDVSTNDATVVASDLQAGVSCYARGQKIVGTGKSFEFASYGSFSTNWDDFVPSDINIIHISSVDKPVQLAVALNNMKNLDFTTPVEIGSVIIDNTSYPIFASVNDNMISITCEKTVMLQIFYGKDNYV